MKLSGVGTRRQALTLAALAALLGLFVVRWATVGAGGPSAPRSAAPVARPGATTEPDEAMVTTMGKVGGAITSGYPAATAASRSR